MLTPTIVDEAVTMVWALLDTDERVVVTHTVNARDMVEMYESIAGMCRQTDAVARVRQALDKAVGVGAVSAAEADDICLALLPAPIEGPL